MASKTLLDSSIQEDTSPSIDSFIHIVDTADTTDSPQGTSKRSSLRNAIQSMQSQILIWAYQDLTATGTSLTITENQNADTAITSLDNTKIITDSSIVTLSSNVNQIPYTAGFFGILSGQITATNTGESITLSAVPRTADQSIRVWYKYRVRNNQVPEGYNEAPSFIRQQWMASIDSVFATDADIEILKTKAQRRAYNSTDNDIVYLGYHQTPNVPSSSDSLAGFAIIRINYVFNNDSTAVTRAVTYADGNKNYDNIWDNRESLTYSIIT